MGTLNLDADFSSHHIEGYAAAAIRSGRGNAWFSVPLISHVEGNLWQGGCIDGVRLPDDFRYVVSLYPWEQYELGPNTVRVEHRLYDSEDVPDLEQLLQIARQVNEMCNQGTTLVHCQAGLNRSGLIAGLALVLKGRSANDAISLLRAKRCEAVLCNEAFERALRTLTVEKA